MTPELAAALAAMTPVERRILRSYAKPRPDGEDGWTPFIAALFVGLVVELDAIEADETYADALRRAREAAVIEAMDAPLRAEHAALVEAADAKADWSHVPAPEPRTVDWFPWTVPDSPAGLEPQPRHQPLTST
jgi:hypothetical protein